MPDITVETSRSGPSSRPETHRVRDAPQSQSQPHSRPQPGDGAYLVMQAQLHSQPPPCQAGSRKANTRGPRVRQNGNDTGIGNGDDGSVKAALNGRDRIRASNGTSSNAVGHQDAGTGGQGQRSRNRNHNKRPTGSTSNLEQPAASNGFPSNHNTLSGAGPGSNGQHSRSNSHFDMGNLTHALTTRDSNALDASAPAFVPNLDHTPLVAHAHTNATAKQRRRRRNDNEHEHNSKPIHTHNHVTDAHQSDNRRGDGSAGRRSQKDVGRSRNRNRNANGVGQSQSQPQSQTHSVPTSDAEGRTGQASNHGGSRIKPSRRAAGFQGKLTTQDALTSQSPSDNDDDDDDDEDHTTHRNANLAMSTDALERAATGLMGAKKRGKAVLGTNGNWDLELEMGKERDDLTSKLMRGLSRRPFLECPICFSPLLPSQAIWSCSPASTAKRVTTSDEALTCCYTPFHLSCIKDWSSRSLDESRERARDRDPALERPPITWRCPGCQKHRDQPVQGYACYCGAVKNLTTSASAHTNRKGRAYEADNSIGNPHSCGQNCTRPRASCDHPCPLPCHPGPCPPCMVQLVVPCPSHETPLTVKCSSARGSNVPAPVCDETCDRPKACGNPAHRCQESCHEPPCETCDQAEIARCYCGREEKEVECGWRRQNETECHRPSSEEVTQDGSRSDETWTGRYGCGRECSRLYDCGIHTCTKTPISDLQSTPRTKCTDPIPACSKRCPRPLSHCDHPCPMKCHLGPCPPCNVDVTVPCRCGESKITMKCFERSKAIEETGIEAVVLCDRVCRALRSCGRHECGRQCCPLSYKVKSKGKKRDLAEAEDDPAGLHTCQLVCGKTLSCGLHACPMLDHKGPCGRCLEASYDELVCHCGRTVVLPPIACGTVINCTYPCNRPDPSCGHPKTAHTCHEDDACPPCPYLASKPCACGKNMAVKNVRCSQEKVTCGQVCNSLLDCGYHHCQKLCHIPGECEECHQVCRKPKKLCRHPCPAQCHAPSACPEDEACTTTITQTCPCGHLQQRATCGACLLSPTSKETVQLKCIPECLQRQRNARLSEALGIRRPTEQPTEYSAELKFFASNNHAFVLTVEKTFADFFMSPKQAMILPHTPPAKRQMLMQLAEHYRFTTELVDQEPYRSVQIRRRVDSRIPSPLLSASVQNNAAEKRTLGGLGDMKGSSSTAAASARASPWGSAVPTPIASPGLGSSVNTSSSTTTSWGPPSKTSSSKIHAMAGNSTSKPQPSAAPASRKQSPRTSPNLANRLVAARSSGHAAETAGTSNAAALVDPDADDWDKSDTEA